jgi:Zinc binding domain
MSRAFMKEPETSGPSCPSPPGCGGVGVPVSRATLEARLRPEAAARFAGAAYFCPDPACEVAYFDAGRERAPRSEMIAPAWPKHPGAPLCACFGVTREVLEDFGRRGDKAEMRAFLERTSSPEARCELLAADGRCCATEARRVFLRSLESSKGS